MRSLRASKLSTSRQGLSSLTNFSVAAWRQELSQSCSASSALEKHSSVTHYAAQRSYPLIVVRPGGSYIMLLGVDGASVRAI